jgi:TfoX/Sxy family transcriptional regulator of competence genes
MLAKPNQSLGSKECVMAFDVVLSERIRTKMYRRSGFTEKKMFGGICYMLNGNICCGVIKDEMVVRLDPDQTDEVLAHSCARIFDYSGHPMKGWFFISPEGVRSDQDLARWTTRSIQYAKSLPPKKE